MNSRMGRMSICSRMVNHSEMLARGICAIVSMVSLCFFSVPPSVAEVLDPYTGPSVAITEQNLQAAFLASAEAGGSINVSIRSLNSQSFPFVFLDVDAEDTTGACAVFDSQNVTALEDGLRQSQLFTVTPPNENQGVRLVDVVFIMDNSGSMGDDQLAVRNNVYGFVDRLTQAGINYSLGVTRYGQAASSGAPIIENSGNLTSSVEFFKDTLWTRNVIDGGREPGYWAIVASAANFNFRPGSRRVFIIITDESPDQGGATFSQAAAALQSGDVTLFAVTTASLYPSFQGLVADPAQQLLGLSTSFDQIFATITGLLADTYRISYKAANEVIDGAERTVEIQVSCGADMGSDTTTYIPGSAPRILRTAATVQLSTAAQPRAQSVTIAVRVVDNVEPLVRSDGVTLYYRRSGGGSNAPYSVVSMSNVAEDVFSAQIPAGDVLDPGLDYYIAATDGSNASTEPATDAATRPYTIAVLPNEPPVLLHIPVTSAAAGIPVVVCAGASDATTALAGVALHFRKRGSLVYQTAAMAPATSGPCPQGASLNNFQASIPGEQVTLSGVEYFIDAFDDFNVHTTSGTAGEPNSIAVFDAPSISALSAYEGTAGSAINISGTGFGPTQGSGSVLVCGLSATVLYWTSQEVGIEIPIGISSGNACDLLLTNDAGSSSGTETFLVTETVTILGSIREADGKPVPGAVVELANPIGFALVRTGSDGGYRAVGLPSGAYTVTPSKSGYTFGPPATWINVSSGTTNSVSFVATPSTPTLRKVSPDYGQPDATVTLTGRGFGSYDATSSRVEFETSDGVLLASVVTWAADSIEVVAPVASGGAMVSVVTASGISNALSFQYRSAPKDVFVLVGGDFNPLDFSRFTLVRADSDTATYDIRIRNSGRIWYYVTPRVIGAIAGGQNLQKPFLLGPSAERSLGQITFARKSYLSLFADATVSFENCPPTCDTQTLLLSTVTTAEFAFRVALGAPFPTDLAEGFVTGLDIASPAFRLAHDLYTIASGDAPQSFAAMSAIFGDLRDLPDDPFFQTLDQIIIQRFNKPGFTWSTAFGWTQWVSGAAYSLEYVTNALDPAVPKFGTLEFSAK